MLPAVQVKNITKTYRLYEKPVHRLLEAVTRRPWHQQVTSLEPLSFDLPPGGTLGIIGENGAGKSTLLKILAGTLTPTTGRIHISGRVSALLELGAGFHSEFTGRQNIYLNAALHGLSNTEISEKEKSIIDFADIKGFIDRPIKTYSSGMTIRLAFSIATSINPDILIIDEALSVGDQRFQQKCVDRMSEFQKAGKTLVVCSHSMYMINTLCRDAIWLDNGALKEQGGASEVISAYLAAQEAKQETDLEQKNAEKPTGDLPDVTVESVQICDRAGTTLDQIQQFDDMVVKIRLKRHIKTGFEGHVALVLKDSSNTVVFGTLTDDQCKDGISFAPQQTVELVLPELPLQKGTYKAAALVTDVHRLRLVHQNESAPCLVHSNHPEYGILWMAHEWKI